MSENRSRHPERSEGPAVALAFLSAIPKGNLLFPSEQTPKTRAAHTTPPNPDTNPFTKLKIDHTPTHNQLNGR